MFTSQQQIWSTKMDFYNQLRATDFFLYPQKTSENQRFSVGIEREQWHEMG